MWGRCESLGRHTHAHAHTYALTKLLSPLACCAATKNWTPTVSLPVFFVQVSRYLPFGKTLTVPTITVKWSSHCFFPLPRISVCLTVQNLVKL